MVARVDCKVEGGGDRGEAVAKAIGGKQWRGDLLNTGFN